MAFKQKTLNIFFLIDEALKRHLPLAAFRLPAESSVQLILQDSPSLNVLGKDSKLLEQKGFAFFPFVNSSLPQVLIKADYHVVDDENLSDETLISILRKFNFSENGYYRPVPHASSKKEFCEGVAFLLREIANGSITKAVLSRVLLHSQKKNFQPVNYFRSLLKLYPQAMAYMVYLPRTGFWIGATPELLVQTENDLLSTVSLAGTKKQETAPVKWGLKELMEHKIVTDHIKSCLDKYFDDFEMRGPDTIQAGPVAHLKTSFLVKSSKLHIRHVLDDLLKELHPTPAVAGVPRETALALLAKTEKHDRAYYAGFLGPVELHEKTQLFVNLRCMEVLHERLALYAGAGITANSNPEKEWEETQLKAQTLLNAL
ncbi:MAG TPA: isochorismate synthase [Chitinophagales bacterium]|nr:isochorismate synthase [Chitinophagales bacterium]